MNKPKPVDILMCVGLQFYSLSDLVSEAENQGLSKRIPLSAIPEGVVPYESKLFVAHPHAIVKVTAPNKTLKDLVNMLISLGVLAREQLVSPDTLDWTYWEGETLLSEEQVPIDMLTIAIAVDLVEGEAYQELLNEFALKFEMGIVGFSYISGIHYVVKPGEEGLPDTLSHLDGYVTPVKMVYGDEP